MIIWSMGNHLRHSLFDHPARKRKHSPTTGSSSSEESDIGEGHPTKRQRCSVLEQGLAHLSLQPPPFTPERCSEDGYQESVRKLEPPFAEMAAEDSAMDGIVDASSLSTGPVVLPSSVEEPEPEIQEVQMKPSSWYELSPDRIVITDLDSYDAEDEDGNEGTNMTINTSLLECIKRRQILMTSHTPSPQSSSQALVLFRSLLTPVIAIQKGFVEEKSADRDPQRIELEEEQKTDIEPMEIEYA